MKGHKQNLLGNPFRRSCKFSKQCHLFSKSSVTCRKSGGNYCGQYRELTLRLQPKVQSQPLRNGEDGTSFMVNPNFYEPVTAETKEEQ